MIKKILSLSIFILAVFFVFSNANAAPSQAANEINLQLQNAAGPTGAGLPNPVDPRVTAALIIRSVLGLIGIMLIALNVYSGFLWITAGGNEEQVTKAKTIIRNSTIGLIVVLSAYSLTILVAHLAQGYISNDYGYRGGALGVFGFH